MPPRASLGALQSNPTGQLSAGVLPAGAALEVVWRDIADCLQDLAELTADLPRNENGLTQMLIDTLEQRPGSRPYYFQREDMENVHNGNSRRLDIAAKARNETKGYVLLEGIPHASGNRFLAVEAKRLPTPGADREREYLAGDLGGLERFKRGLHGGELRSVGMIGYVQEHDFTHWVQILNQWIDDLIRSSPPALPWEASDKLTLDGVLEAVASLRSTNLRITDNQRLAIRHLWVDVSAKG